MNERDINDWLLQAIPRHENLTTTVVSILENLLRAENIDFLAVTGRTKTLDSVSEKLRRKNYRNPKLQLTDISGVRVILYFESHLDRAAKLVEDSFRVDKENSRNRDAVLSIDQIGYRSVHYVCDLGPSRTQLPEYSPVAELKFEIQLRTVLQHAWAELAHDSNYKFSGKLPRPIERQLYLYAGMLEIADKGFDSLSHQIDSYKKEVREKTEGGNFKIELDSVSLDQFVQSWARETEYSLVLLGDKDASGQMVKELNDYGIQTLEELRAIIPPQYANIAKELSLETNIFGLLRDWMILNDFQRYRNKAWKQSWSGFGFGGDQEDTDRKLYERIVGEQEAKRIFATFNIHEV